MALKGRFSLHSNRFYGNSSDLARRCLFYSELMKQRRNIETHTHALLSVMVAEWQIVASHWCVEVRLSSTFFFKLHFYLFLR